MTRNEQINFILQQKLNSRDIKKIGKILWGLQGLGKAPWELNSIVIENELPRKELNELDDMCEKYVRKRRLS